jgi:hypothetical protein
LEAGYGPLAFISIHDWCIDAGKAHTMEKKDCFGKLDLVFPVGEDGLRRAPSACFACPERTECMRAAMKTRDGIRMQEAMLERSAESGIRGRIRRWSRGKELQRMARDRKKGMPP